MPAEHEEKVKVTYESEGFDKVSSQLSKLDKAVAGITDATNGISQGFSSAVNATKKVDVAVSSVNKNISQLGNSARDAFSNLTAGAREVQSQLEENAGAVSSVGQELSGLTEGAREVAAQLEETAVNEEKVADNAKKVATEVIIVEAETKKLHKWTLSLNSSLKDVARSLRDSGLAAKSSIPFYEKLIRSFKRIFFYRMVRKTLSEIAQGAKEGVVNITNYSNALNGLDASNVVQAMNNLASASLYLKNCLGMVLAPVLSMLGAKARTVAEAFGELTSKIAQFFAALNGQKTYTAAKYVATQTGVIEDNTAKATENVKELKRTLMGFDEINRLDAPDKDSSNKNGSGSSSPGFGDMFEELPISDSLSKLADKIMNIINILEGFLLGALLAIGVILIATGHVGIGIACMIAGLAFITVAAVKWIKAKKFTELFETIEGAVGGFLTAIGVILIATGQIGLGVACLVGGLLVTAYTIASNLAPDTVKGVLNMVAAIVGGFLGVLGVILICTGHIPIGVALFITGMALAVASAAETASGGDISEHIRKTLAAVCTVASAFLGALGLVLICTGHALIGAGLLVAGIAVFNAGAEQSEGADEEEISTKVQKALKAVENVVAVVLPIVGVILLCFGVIPAGLALVGVGILDLFAVTAVSDDDEGKTLSQKVGDALTVVLATVSPFMGTVGIILMCTGQPLLGIALLVAGAVGTFSGYVLEDTNETISPKVRNTLTIVKEVAGAFMGVVGLVLACTGHVGWGIALIVAGIATLFVGVKEEKDSDTISPKVTAVLNNVKAIAGTLMGVVGLILICCAHIPLGVGLIVAGIATLFTGAKEDENDETKIEKQIDRVLEYIKTAAAAVAGVLGLIFICTGNLPLGIFLLVLGITGLIAEAREANTDETITPKVKTVLTEIETIIGGFLAGLGIIFCVCGNVPLGVGLLALGIASIVAGDILGQDDEGKSLIERVYGVINKIQDFFVTKWNEMKEFAKEIIDEIIENVSGMAQGVVNWFVDVANKISNTFNDLTSFIGNCIDAVLQFLGIDFKIKMPHLTVDFEYVGGGLGDAMDFLGIPRYLPSFTVEWYAKGGFPDKGDLFIANEAGAEMVGSMGGKTTVANQQEITDGIAKGVFDAIVRAGGFGGGETVIEIDGREVFRAVAKENSKSVMQTGRSPLLV